MSHHLERLESTAEFGNTGEMIPEPVVDDGKSATLASVAEEEGPDESAILTGSKLAAVFASMLLSLLRTHSRIEYLLR